jgi:hypothetical protein
MKNTLIIYYILLITSALHAQTYQGMVMTENEEGKMEALPGAFISWIGTSQGVVSNEYGMFKIEKTGTDQTSLIFSCIGYTSDTVQAGDVLFLHIMLRPASELNTVLVETDGVASALNTISTINLETLNKPELKKAACCNLSESFETNAAVDVEYTDAITGARSIRMLGLDGIYALIMTENMPTVRGLASSYGLTYIPGPWIESIQISKGVGSVVNGYEGLTGAINTELHKPYEIAKEKFMLNLFGSNSERFEANLNSHHLINEHLSTSILLHTGQLHNAIDHNNDTFLDAPLTENYIFMNRWNYASGKMYESQAGLKLISSNLLGGQLNFNENAPRDTSNGYGVGVDTKRIEAYLKNGFVFSRPSTSIGTVLSGAWHHADNFYGLNNYTGEETYLHVNIIGQTFLFNTEHLFKTGFSFLWNDFAETYDSVFYQRTEKVPGVFAEYYYKSGKNLDMLIGTRLDQHNLYGTFFTPRAHVKYTIGTQTTLRLSGGKGYRVPNLFAENTSILTSSRELVLQEALLPEQGWNYGISIIHKFTLRKHEGSFSADMYRTDFINQLIIDLDSDAEKIYVSNLHGQSFSTVVQAELNYEVVEHFDLRAAYKFTDVQTTFGDTLLKVPLTYKHRGLMNASYKTNTGGWVLDATAQFYGKARLPELEENHAAHHVPDASPAYMLLLAQITKKWERLEVYAGSENLTNYTQHEPIISASDPFGQYFDASVIYAPVMSRKFYLGMRFTIQEK